MKHSEARTLWDSPALSFTNNCIPQLLWKQSLAKFVASTLAYRHCACSLTHSVLLETIPLLIDEAFELIKQSSTSYSAFKALDHTVLSDKLHFQIQQHCQVLWNKSFLGRETWQKTEAWWNLQLIWNWKRYAALIKSNPFEKVMTLSFLHLKCSSLFTTYTDCSQPASGIRQFK